MGLNFFSALPTDVQERLESKSDPNDWTWRDARRGGLGSNVYPSVDEGVFAMTNRIVASVVKISDGAASVTRLAMDKEKGCGEVKFFWERKTGGISELIVRGYVNARRQMAVCTLLHTKGDGISAEMNFHKLP